MDRDFKRPVRRHRTYGNIITSRAVDATAPQRANISKMPTAAKPKGRKISRKKWLLITVISLIVLGGGISGYMYKRGGSPLDSYVKLYDFPLYYPSKIPNGYALVKTSLKPANNLFIYNLKGLSSSSTITITQQALPSDFDAAKLTSKDAHTTSMPSGTLYDLSIGGISKYMLTANEGTLIFINATTKLSKESANALASNLQPVK